MTYPGMTISDLPVTLLYLVLYYWLARFVVRQRYAGSPLARHFYWGLSLKFFGCIAFALIYQFYYQGGDTFRYYANASTITRYFFTQPEVFLDLLTALQIPKSELGAYHGITDTFSRPATFMVTRIGAILGIPAFGLYLPAALSFAFFSFLGIWAMYRVTCRLYPDATHLTVIPLLYIPSCFFWGSAYMQESLVIGCLGGLIWGLYRIASGQRLDLLSVVLLIGCSYVLIHVKEYILLAFLPAAIVWVVFTRLGSFQYKWLRWLLRPLVLGIIIGGSIGGLTVLGSFSERYNVENVLQTAEITATYLQRITREQGGALYSLGEVDYSPAGIARIVPAAIIVTLFRPWPWEVRNPVMLLSALEGTLFLIMTFYIIFRVGPFRLVSLTISDPFLLACLLFSLTFAFAVGASTYNFGSLARYKIPGLFFYGLWLAGSLAHYLRHLPAPPKTSPATNPSYNADG